MVLLNYSDINYPPFTTIMPPINRFIIFLLKKIYSFKHTVHDHEKYKVQIRRIMNFNIDIAQQLYFELGLRNLHMSVVRQLSPVF